jgi:hypothetical protein
MKEIQINKITGFIAVESEPGWDYHLWGFECPFEVVAVDIINWLINEMETGPGIINIYGIESNSVNIQLFNVKKKEVLHVKDLPISDASLLAITHYREHNDFRRVYLAPFGTNHEGIYAPAPGLKLLEVIPNKIMVR